MTAPSGDHHVVRGNPITDPTHCCDLGTQPKIVDHQAESSGTQNAANNAAALATTLLIRRGAGPESGAIASPDRNRSKGFMDWLPQLHARRAVASSRVLQNPAWPWTLVEEHSEVDPESGTGGIVGGAAVPLRFGPQSVARSCARQVIDPAAMRAAGSNAFQRVSTAAACKR